MQGNENQSTKRWRPARLCNFVDDATLVNTPPSWLEDYKLAFLDELGRINQQLRIVDEPVAETWCYFVFSAIVFGHVCGPSALASLAKLTWGDIFCAAEGYLLLPRMDGRIPVYISPVVRVCALGLCIQLMRGRGPGRNRLGAYPSDWSALPGRDDPETELTPGEVARASARFRVWFREFTDRHNLPAISVDRLLALACWHLQSVYSSPVAGALLGITRYCPAPVDRTDLLTSYRRTLARPAPPRSSPRARQRPIKLYAQRPIKQSASLLPPTPPEEGHEHNVERIRAILRSHRKLDKGWARSQRNRVARQLNSLAQSFEDAAAKIDVPSEAASISNSAYVASWMGALAHECSLATMEAYFSDVCNLIELYPERLVSELDTQAYAAALAFYTNANTRNRKVSSFRSLWNHLRDSRRLPVPDIQWWRLTGRQSIGWFDVIAQDDFVRLLNCLARTEVYHAALLGFFFGLRSSEVCHLKTGDVWLHRTPALLVRDSKRRKSRAVPGLHIPQWVLATLNTHLERRLEQTTGNRSAWFLAHPDGRPIQPSWLSRCIKRGLQDAGLGWLLADYDGPLHLLRHGCANRLMAKGVDLVDIARVLGHSSVDTTLHTYAHVMHLLQREQLQSHADPLLAQTRFRFVPLAAAAALLGLTNRGVDAVVRQAGSAVRYWLHSELFDSARPGRERRYLSLDDWIELAVTQITNAEQPG